MPQKVILVDLDGVLNTYTGDYDENVMPPIKEGAYNFVENLAADYAIKIFTTRNRLLVSKWILQNNLTNYISDVTNIKEPCYLIIDDRCINFNGNYSDIKEKINNFKVWYK